MLLAGINLESRHVQHVILQEDAYFVLPLYTLYDSLCHSRNVPKKAHLTPDTLFCYSPDNTFTHMVVLVAKLFNLPDRQTLLSASYGCS
jgi:hypothetical protein